MSYKVGLSNSPSVEYLHEGLIFNFEEECSKRKNTLIYQIHNSFEDESCTSEIMILALQDRIIKVQYEKVLIELLCKHEINSLKIANKTMEYNANMWVKFCEAFLA